MPNETSGTFWDWIDRHVPAELSERVDRAAHGINAYGYDKWGFSPSAAKRSLLVSEFLYRRYFRVQTHGIERVPEGRGLLIGNHSAQMAYDGMMVATAMLLKAEPPRAVRAMIEKFFQLQPLVNVFLARNGQLTGLPENCERLLRADEHLSDHYILYGEESGVRSARKHIGWAVRTLPGGEAFRAVMNTLDDAATQLRAVATFFDHLADGHERLPVAPAAANQDHIALLA